MSSFLQRQANYLLQNHLYAFFLAAALAFIPFAAWLSLTIIAFVTLRKGPYEGVKLLVVGGLAAAIASNYDVKLPYSNYAICVTFLLGYVGSVILRISTSWKVVATFILTSALLIIAIFHLFFSIYVNEQLQLLLSLFKEIGQADLVGHLLDKQLGANKELLANYLLGIKVLSVILSSMASVMMARYIQSLLFYPGGFRKEILAFRASRAGVLLLAISTLGAINGNLIAISFLPVIIAYLMAAGMSLFFNLMSRKRDLYVIFLLIVPLMIAPFVMLIVYVLFGSLDSLFNFRYYLPSKASK